MTRKQGRGLNKVRAGLHKHLPPEPPVPVPTEMLDRTYRVTGGEHVGHVGVCIDLTYWGSFTQKHCVRLRFDDWLVQGWEYDEDGNPVLDRPRPLVPVEDTVWVGYLQEESPRTTR